MCLVALCVHSIILDLSELFNILEEDAERQGEERPLCTANLGMSDVVCQSGGHYGTCLAMSVACLISVEQKFPLNVMWNVW